MTTFKYSDADKAKVKPILDALETFAYYQMWASGDEDDAILAEGWRKKLVDRIFDGMGIKMEQVD